MENSERRRNNEWLEILESQKNVDVFISIWMLSLKRL